MSKINEFIEALREGVAYDWIANHGYSLRANELIDIIKEYDYAIHSMTPLYEKTMYCAIADELEEMYEEE